MVRVLVVDDSAFMRSALSNMLQSDPEIQIVGVARDGLEATMDIEMPRMDGISALRHIMTNTPVPVIMVSSLTTEGAHATLEALEIGAVDFIPKNLSDLSLNILRLKEVLIDKIKQLAKQGVTRRAFRPAVRPPSASQARTSASPVMRTTGDRRAGVVAIGTSTGGPKALQEILPNLPKEFPLPIVIAQHMPPNFTGPFAERLNQLSKIEVREAKEGDALRPGLALVSPGGGHMRVIRKRGIETVVTISDDRENFIYRPSVDALMLSVAETFPGRALGVILTGMGNDGAKGMTELKRTGGRIFAQNEESCVVYGMPKAVVDAGIADKILSLEEIAGEIVNSA